jgi:hypothetical protein
LKLCCDRRHHKEPVEDYQLRLRVYIWGVYVKRCQFFQLWQGWLARWSVAYPNGPNDIWPNTAQSSLTQCIVSHSCLKWCGMLQVCLYVTPIELIKLTVGSLSVRPYSDGLTCVPQRWRSGRSVFRRCGGRTSAREWLWSFPAVPPGKPGLTSTGVTLEQQGISKWNYSIAQKVKFSLSVCFSSYVKCEMCVCVCALAPLWRRTDLVPNATLNRTPPPRPLAVCGRAYYSFRNNLIVSGVSVAAIFMFIKSIANCS